ncbi:hypothetical protein F4604DRAFT_1927043 [Suillus subluteus]|nr:hypothetical protein F4604DRAFT_1927043 [Suillus subluteus]
MSHYAPFATTQLSWIEDMMAHVQADWVVEFSTSGSGDDISVFWEPDSSYFTDPFATHSPTDSTIPPPPSTLENFPTLSSSPIGSPSTQLLVGLGDTDAWHGINSFVIATVSTNEKKRSRTLDARIGQPDEQKENKTMQAEVGRVGGGVIQARASRTTSARQTYKRKIEDVDTEPETDQENFDISPNPAPVETRKRICREKTGTDWQMVLDIIKYGEQRSRQSQMEDIKANI